MQGLHERSLFNPAQLVEEVRDQRDIRVLGITGQTGAGKTDFGRTIQRTCREREVPHQILEFDWFHRWSRAERQAMLFEPGIAPDEALRRRDLSNWYDFDRLDEVLAQLRRGQAVHMKKVYNFEDNGQMTLDVNLYPREGILFILEGILIAHLSDLDRLVFLYAPSDVRYQRLLHRNHGHRPINEHDDRFAFHQQFEVGYFALHWQRLHLFVDNSVVPPVILGKTAAAKESLLELPRILGEEISAEAVMND